MRVEKELLLGSMEEMIEESENFIIAGYKGLKSNVMNDFRTEIDKVGGDFEVVRKRVFMKALAAKNISIDPQMLEGHVGIVFAKGDAVETCKSLFKFAKENPNVLDVTGAHFEGAVLDATQVKAMSKLPSKDEMRAQFLGTLEAPMSQTLAVMDALLTSVVHCLNNKVQMDEKN